MHQMHRWLTTGTPPPTMPRIDIGGEPPAIRRDELLIALGGIRMPQVAVPLATLRGSGDGADLLAELSGSCQPFTAATLQRLYPSRSDYLRRVEAAIAAGTSSGFLLERDTARIRQQAEAAADAIPERVQD